MNKNTQNYYIYNKGDAIESLFSNENKVWILRYVWDWSVETEVQNARCNWL